MFPTKVPEFGYVTISSILSDQVVVEFSVPCHEWSKLEASKEWRDFQVLLERCQKEHSHREEVEENG